MENFLAEPHVLVTRTSGHGMAEDVLQKLGAKRRIKLRLPHFSMYQRLKAPFTGTPEAFNQLASAGSSNKLKPL
jgi:hypothetical protein